jgi:hypothetical protein
VRTFIVKNENGKMKNATPKKKKKKKSSSKQQQQFISAFQHSAFSIQHSEIIRRITVRITALDWPCN